MKETWPPIIRIKISGIKTRVLREATRKMEVEPVMETRGN